jgi:pyrroline-5-carboxylate reductase
MENIAFIGSGNMATSLIGGLITEGYLPHAITACDTNADALKKMEAQFGINTSTDNVKAAANSNVIVLAVKPQILKSVALDLALSVSNNPNKPIVISIVAGITAASLCRWMGSRTAVIRCMPNTPALVQEGVTGLYANRFVSDNQKDVAEGLMRGVGSVIWVNSEELIDAVTAVSGSGPAYFFLLMEAMVDAGVKQGLSADQASQLTLQTALGAAKLAHTSSVRIAELRHRVTSPGGTTEAAIEAFEAAGFRAIVERAVIACSERSKAMGDEFDE